MLAAFGAAACERTPAPEPLASARESGAPVPSAAPHSDGESIPRIVCLGDSLTAGLGVKPDEAYPALLERRLRDAGYRYEVVNAGVSGDTSAGALRRLEWSLDDNVRVLIVAIGGNDGLRGLPAAELRRNLAAIIETAQSRGVAVLLAGMEAPPNFGPAYTREFRAVYADLAKRYRVGFVPFLLAGVAGVRELNQADGVHPTAEGQRAMADLIWPELERLVRTLETG
ncbi:MAG TPA: arylesterase [Vicinamibacterales bacterium]|nr:arylesterase [Vicinamibacterales bacterium]